MRESPRVRRLRNDCLALERLRAESSIFDFEMRSKRPKEPPELYLVRFRGRGLSRPQGFADVCVREHHEIRIELSAGYPRMMPELRWKTPIFHPNISGNGMVCLGGYGTFWVPSLQLDQLCEMLWDIIRYENFDVKSPYNREAALWAGSQKAFRFPLDQRPLRDRKTRSSSPHQRPAAPPVIAPAAAEPEVLFLDGGTIVEAEVVPDEQPEILFIE